MKYEISPLIQREPLTSKNKNTGFSLVEVILALATFALMVTGMVGAYMYGQQTIAFAGNLSRATLLAEEGLEAARNIRDENFQNLTPGSYGLNVENNQWILSGTEDHDDLFVRQLTIEDVDADRKKITSTVNWNNGVKANKVSLETYLTYWRRVVELTKNWYKAFEMSQLNITGGSPGYKIATSGSYAYVVRASSTPNFVSINISESSNPYTIANLNLSTGINNIFISGNYAYLASSSNSAELQIVDISDPSKPVLAGVYNDAGNEDAKGIYVVGTKAYLALSGGSDFLIIDISKPTAPVGSGALTLSGNANDIVVKGNYAYVATSDNTSELQVINISNAAKPTLIGSTNLSGNNDLSHLTLSGDTVITGRVGSEVNLIDLTNPTSPTLLSNYTATGNINDVAVDDSGNFVFLATNGAENEFEIIDISEKISPTKATSIDLEFSLNGVIHSSDQNLVLSAGDDKNKELFIFGPG